MLTDFRTIRIVVDSRSLQQCSAFSISTIASFLVVLLVLPTGLGPCSGCTQFAPAALCLMPFRVIRSPSES